MNKILANLSSSSDITELLLFLDKHHPDIVQESVTSVEKDKSFFLHFAYGINNNYEKIKFFYEINKKYGYSFENKFNKTNYVVNDMEKILSNSMYADRFIIDCLNTLTDEERVKTIIDSDLLLNAFKNNKVELLKDLEKYPEVWNQEKRLKVIKEHYLTSFELSELFSKNTNQDNVEVLQTQCKDFIIKDLKYITKENADSRIDTIKKYLQDMLKNDKAFSQDFKEEIVGISLMSGMTKVTNSVIKTLFNERLSIYEPKKPLWLHFEHLQNKDILYDFLDKFNYQDFWEDDKGNKHYKIDYLEKALTNMSVTLETQSYSKNNKAKRDVSITNNVLPLLKEYWLAEVDGKMGYTRELLKEESKFKGQVTIIIPEDNDKAKELLEKTVLYQENGNYIFIEKVGYHMGHIKNLYKAFKENLIPKEAIKKIVENFNIYKLDQDILEYLKQYVVEEKMVLNLDNLLENKKKIWGDDKKMLEDLERINQYNIAYHNHQKMQQRYENVPENKTKRAKI